MDYNSRKDDIQIAKKKHEIKIKTWWMNLTVTGSPISRCGREWLRSSMVYGEALWYNHIKDVFPSLKVLPFSVSY